MSTPIHAQVTGQFNAGADPVAVTINLPSQYDKFEMYSLTAGDYAAGAGVENILYAVGTSYMPAGYAQYNTGAGGGSIAESAYTTVDGFTFLADTGNQTPGAPVAITGINNANPAVVTTPSSAGLVPSSSIVRITNSTGMLTIAGMDFTVGTVADETHFQLAYLDSTIANLAGVPATAGFYRIIPYNPRFYPVRRYITNITRAASAVIKLSVTHGYTVGQQVRIYVPGPIAGIPNSGFGMTQMNAQMATITAIDLVNNTITVNINSTGYTAFSFPSSASIGGMGGGGTNFAFVEPFGEAATTNPPVANLLDDATRNVSISGVTIGTLLQNANSSYQWIATKGVAVS